MIDLISNIIILFYKKQLLRTRNLDQQHMIQMHLRL